MADRYYFPGIRSWEPGGRGYLVEGDSAQHLLRVMRVREGDRVRFFDGKSLEALCLVEEAQRRSLRVQCLELGEASSAPVRHLELCFSSPRGARVDGLIEHATALGVRSFHPVICEHTPARSRAAEVPERWRRIAIASLGQCGLVALPEFHAPMALKDWLGRVAAEFPGERWVAARGGEPLPAKAAAQASGGPARAALLAVGPEGGFSEAERVRFQETGFAELGLGPAILRTELAAWSGLVRLSAVAERAVQDGLEA